LQKTSNGQVMMMADNESQSSLSKDLVSLFKFDMQFADFKKKFIYDAWLGITCL